MPKLEKDFARVRAAVFWPNRNAAARRSAPLRAFEGDAGGATPVDASSKMANTISNGLRKTYNPVNGGVLRRRAQHPAQGAGGDQTNTEQRPPITVTASAQKLSRAGAAIP
jgi:hypothetical protein